LAGIPRGEDVDGFDAGPVGRREVAVVGDVGPVVGEDAAGCGVVFDVPGDGAAEDGLDARV
jgi:hypothetical protein